MGAPVRAYQRCEQSTDGTLIPISAKTTPNRKKPFAAEYALLEELGLTRR